MRALLRFRILPIALFLFLAGLSLPGRATEEAGASQQARDAGPVYLRALERAAVAYAQRDFPVALEKLELADQIHPGVQDTWSMRGAIYAEQRAYEKAEDAFDHASALAPENFWPRYNLAQLLFMQKKYAAAEAAFEKLGDDPQHRELVQFKLILLDLIQNNPGKASVVLQSMKEPSDTAAYYFAHAAWEFAHQNQREGQYWVVTGIKIFGLERCYSMYDALADLGYVSKRTAKMTGIPPLSLPMATPAVLP